jgi:MSHA biogenesis protein MshQ
MKPYLTLFGGLCLTATPLHAALIAQYGFDTATPYQNDANPGTLNGTAIGNATLGASLAPGLGPNSLLVDGTGDGIQLPNGSNIINGAVNVTISAFFTATTLPGAGGVANIAWIGRNGSDTEVRFGLQLFDSNKVRVIGRATDGGSSGNAVFNANLTIGTLYHLAATVNYANGNVDFYLNGAFFGSQAGIANLNAATDVLPNTNSNRAAIGANGIVGGEYFNGRIDDLRIYNEALDAATIAAIAATGGLVPEPSTTLLSISAFGLLLGFRRRS